MLLRIEVLYSLKVQKRICGFLIVVLVFNVLVLKILRSPLCHQECIQNIGNYGSKDDEEEVPGEHDGDDDDHKK